MRLDWFRRQDRGGFPHVSSTSVRWADVGLFVVLAYVLGWGAWLGLRPVFPLAMRTGMAMFAPMFSAIAVIRVRRGRDRLRHHLRLTWPRLLENLLASLMAAGAVGVIMGAGFALSLVTGDLKLPGSSGENLFQVFSAPVAVFLYWITAFGEEYGWRGYLVPELSPLGGAQASVLIAFVFALWHAPIILVDGFNYPKHHVLGVFGMLVFAVPLSVVLCWLRSATRSVAAPATAHATVNMGTGLLYANTARTTSIIAAPVGLLGTLPFAVAAVLLLISGKLWRRAEAPGAVAPVEARVASAS